MNALPAGTAAVKRNSNGSNASLSS